MSWIYTEVERFGKFIFWQTLSCLSTMNQLRRYKLYTEEETAKGAVMALLSDEEAIVMFVLLRLANAERPTGTSFEGV